MVKTKNLQQSVIIKATPREVYEALMDSRKHSKFTGAKASISRKVGGRCSVNGNYIRGINLDLMPNKRIVQAWRGSDWPKGHYSIATFSLSRIKGGTRLIFTQMGVPDREYKGISQGWRDYYWKPMKEMLEK
jgi:activator of HSP90 ATPase